MEGDNELQEEESLMFTTTIPSLIRERERDDENGPPSLSSPPPLSGYIRSIISRIRISLHDEEKKRLTFITT